ncbi:MAG TPA: hypothetical protein PK788_02475 [Gemmatimonadaceae bacterium]|nr:hypothetical protein [Gemmatimonadaceae bacterium]
MPRYRAYGSLLESDFEFPGLPLADDGDAAPRWRFVRCAALPPMREPKTLGADPLYQDVQARLFEHADGWRIAVDDTGEFDLTPDGLVHAAPKSDAWDDFVRSHLLGRVLATAMFRDGWLPLHASAVSTREGVIAFLGPKGVGKSSLASAFVAAGAPLVTDDTLPVEPGTPPMAWPGIPMLRVRADARAAVALHDGGTETRDGKHEIALEDAHQREDRPSPLAAIFLLAPADPARSSTVTRLPFSPALGAAALIAHVKSAQMFGPSGAATLLPRLATLVHLVPVLQLSVVRDLARLPEAAATVLDWYGGPAKR